MCAPLAGVVVSMRWLALLLTLTACASPPSRDDEPREEPDPPQEESFPLDGVPPGADRFEEPPSEGEDFAGMALRTQWAPDGRHIVVDGDIGGLLVDAEGQVRATLTSDRVSQVAFGPRGDRLAIAQDDETWLWDVDAPARLRTLDADGTGCMSFSWDQTRLATCDGSILNVATGRVLHNLPLVGVHGLGWSGDGRYLAAAALSGQLWDIEAGKMILIQGGSCWGAVVAPDARFTAWTISGHTLHAGVFGSVETHPLAEARDCREHHQPVFTSDSRVLHAAGGGTYRALQTGTWRLIGFYEGAAPAVDAETIETVESVSADGRTIAVRRADHSAFVWNAAEMRKVVELPSMTNHELGGFSPDGRQLLRSDAQSVQALSATTGETLWTLRISP